MKPSELYKRIPESETTDLNMLRGAYYNHIPEISLDECAYFNERTVSKNNKVEILIYKEFLFDHRRLWRLASVWYDGTPVMVIQNAGREGDDHSGRYITNFVEYSKMIRYIKSLCPDAMDGEEDCVVDEEEDIPNLASFYGYQLDGLFQSQ